MKIQTTKYICDICGEEASPDANEISFSKRARHLYHGEIEKIGISGTIKVWRSRPSCDGTICDKCKLSYLRLYLKQLEEQIQ